MCWPDTIVLFNRAVFGQPILFNGATAEPRA